MREDGVILHWCSPCGMQVSQTHQCPHLDATQGADGRQAAHDRSHHH